VFESYTWGEYAPHPESVTKICPRELTEIRREGITESTIQDGAVGVAIDVEQNVLTKVTHPHVVSLKGVCLDENNVIFVLEKLDGSLINVLGELNHWKLVISVLVGIARGMKYLHSEVEVLHRDLCTKNVLVKLQKDQNGVLKDVVTKVADFGASKLEMSYIVNGTGSVGTEYYVAPEVADEDQKIQTPSDVFPFGVIIFEVLMQRKCEFDDFRNRPSNAATLKSLFQSEGLRPVLSEEAVEKYSRETGFNELTTLMEECWSQEEASRPSYELIVQRLEAILGQCEGAGQRQQD
jgi:serine/threonine protein kinase